MEYIEAKTDAALMTYDSKNLLRLATLLYKQTCIIDMQTNPVCHGMFQPGSAREQ